MNHHVPILKVSFFFALILFPSAIFSEITLEVKEKAGINRVDEMVHNGIPVSRLSNIVDISDLSIINESGKPVKAQFEVLSRWGGGKLGKNPVQWLLVTFPASVSANSSAKYILKSGSHGITGSKLSLTEDQNRIIVNTGTAKFKISKKSFNVFEEASLLKPIEQKLIGGTGGNALIHVDNKPLMKASTPSEVTIEHQGDLFVSIKVAGYFTNPAYANIMWRYIARYSFFAGSPTAIIDFYYGFPGNKNGTSKFEVYDWSELIKIKNVKLVLPLNLSDTISGSVSGGKNEFLSESLSTNKTVQLKQHLRQRMTAPPVYTMSCGTSSYKGTFAEMPMVAISGSNSGGVGMTIQKMKFYEPQSIVANKNQFEVNIVVDSQWIAPFMGAYAKIAVTLQPSSSNWNSVAKSITSNLDHKIFAWPDRKYVARTGIFDELWDGTDNFYAHSYWNKISTISKNTLQGYIKYGMYGFMTYGLAPRYWFDGMYGNEFGNTNSWDGYFKGGKFSDYHNAFSNVVRQFAQNGDSELLLNLAFPAARRILNTLIIQDIPSSSNHYAGWAPIGYGGYRKDNNASHSYFENLYFYYYLTGDRRVLDVLYPAGKQLRLQYCRRSDGSLVPSQDPPISDWMPTVGRVASQRATIYWFLGHASKDSSFLEDYINQYERLIDRHSSVLIDSSNKKVYAFVSNGDISNESKSNSTAQTWMTALYDMQNIWWLYSELGDVSLGKEKVKISRFFKALNNTYWDYVSNAGGKRGYGTPQGDWANQLTYSWTGDKIEGTLKSVALKKSSESYLYKSGKASLLSFMFRSSCINKDTAQHTQAMEMAKYIIETNGYQNNAWDKPSSLNWVRVHGAIHYMINGMDNIVDIKKGTEPYKAYNSGKADIKVGKSWFNTRNSSLNIAFSRSIKQLEYEVPFHIAVYDTNGRMVADSSGKTRGESITWDTSHLPNGFYIIEVDISKKIYKNKILITK